MSKGGSEKGGVTTPKRLAALGGAVVVTVLTCAGAVGLGPGAALGATSANPAVGSTRGPTPTPSAHSPAGNWLTINRHPSGAPPTPTPTAPTAAATTEPTTPSQSTTAPTAQPNSGTSPALPPNSGSGRRIVYDISAQRVWLVDANGTVARTYLVSGGTDKPLLRPGTYKVSSMSRHSAASGGHDAVNYLVAFTKDRGQALGFHDIPATGDGRLVESRSDLGTFGSVSGISQWVTDAQALWNFARVGTPVVITA